MESKLLTGCVFTDGWAFNAAEGMDIVIFNLYGKAGGSNDPEAAAVTDALLEAVEQELHGMSLWDYGCSTAIKDFNTCLWHDS